MVAKQPSPRHRRRASKPRGAPTPSKPQTASEPLASARLQKLLAAAGFGSRRACEELIRQGRVSINGEIAKLGDSANPGCDVLRLDGEKFVGEELVYWMVNKPEITAPVVGVSKITQLDQLVEACDITLDESDVTYLEELYKPVENLLSIGFS